jgi:hypothetical protein
MGNADMTPEELAAIASFRADLRRYIAALKELEANFALRPHARKLLRSSAELRARYAALDRVVARGDEQAIKHHWDRVRLGAQEVLDAFVALDDAAKRDGRKEIEAMIAAFRAKFPGVLPPSQSAPPFPRKPRPGGGKG